MKRIVALFIIGFVTWFIVDFSKEKSVNSPETVSVEKKSEFQKTELVVEKKTNESTLSSNLYNKVSRPVVESKKDNSTTGSKLSSLDSSPTTPEKKSFFKASQIGDIEAVRAFIKSGADLNQRDENGQTPLFIALDNEHGDIAKLLLKSGANGLVKNKRGVDLSTIAALSGEKEIFLELIKQGAPVNGSVLGKMNLLMSSAMEGHVEIGQVILDKSSGDVSLQDEFGNSALHYAVQGGHLKMAKMLMDYGANQSLKNEEGLTPLEVAEKEGFEKVRDLLRESQSN